MAYHNKIDTCRTRATGTNFSGVLATTGTYALSGLVISLARSHTVLLQSGFMRL